MSNLFDYSREEFLKKAAPLARRLRPQSLAEFVGQEHLLGQGRLLRQAIEDDNLGSAIFYGPPGTGKTALAQAIAHTTRAEFVRLNAAAAGVAEVRTVIKEAGERLGLFQRRTLLFIDEIHRFNKAQQDALLPAVEEGLVTLIGATTENPYFEVNSPLLSRARVFRFEPLKEEEIGLILRRALTDRERGLGRLEVEVEPEAMAHLVRVAGGDARTALNALEMAAQGALPDPEGKRVVTLTLVQEATQQKKLLYDKDGDQHYDTISAFIKSLRGSDPDAAVFWLARMLAAGEDARFIARRLVVHAAEDVGLADPQALTVAVAAAQAVELVGLPEARLPLAEAAIYLACAPKSNAVCRAIDAASADVKNKTITVPPHLRDASYAGAKKLGHGLGYLYPHDFPGHFVTQGYIPPELGCPCYYQPGREGLEVGVRQRLESWWGQERYKDTANGHNKNKPD